MALIQDILNAIDFMEENLLEDMTIRDIAQRANMSPYHFQRTFTILTDMAVGEYIRRRRLTKAAQELSGTPAKIIDLAYKYGYDTPESFTKAFRKQHGITPSQARKGMGRLQAYNRLTIQVNLRGAEPMDYQIMEREAFQVAGLKKIIPCDGEEGPSGEIQQLWGQAGQDGTLAQLLAWNSGEVPGLIGITVDFSNETNELEYWIATACGNEPTAPFSRFEVPAAKWAVFEVVGPVASAVPGMWKKIYAEWFPSTGYQHSGAPSLEVYKSADPASPDAQSEIWVPIQ